MNIAFREIAEKAWVAATAQAERTRQEDIEAKFHLTDAEFHDWVGDKMMRKLATVETISAIKPHDNADALELALVRGWQVVVK